MEIPCNELDGAALRNGNQHNFRQWKSGNLLDINLATGQAALRHNVKPPHNLTKKIQNSTCGSKRRMLDSRLKHHTSSTVQHIKEFVVLWNLIAEITLKENKNDVITWKLTPNGEYTARLAYKAQFFGATMTTIIP